MDRDKRWERVRLAWDAIVEAESDHRAQTAAAALENAYARGENDEFVRPTVIDGAAPMAAGDAVVLMNLRADRSEARRVGNECVRTRRALGAWAIYKQKSKLIPKTQ